MPLKSIGRELQDGIGSSSRRSFEVKLSSHHHRSRSVSGTLAEVDLVCVKDECKLEQSGWAFLPPELLRVVIHRIEASQSSWPFWKHVVSCACVCKHWRDVVKELVKAPEHSGKLTFPISLKQPGPKDTSVQCFIKRDRTNGTFYLYIALTSALVESGKFLLAARKVRHGTNLDYIISYDKDDMSRCSNTYFGKLRSNFLGTKFTIYDSDPPHYGAISSMSRGGRRVGFKQVSPRVPVGSYNVGRIIYELNMLGARGPRRMLCTFPSIPASTIRLADVTLKPVIPPGAFVCDSSLSCVSSASSKAHVADASLTEVQVPKSGFLGEGPLTLRNKTPRWHEHLQCWCLNFRGRVTVASVKNFQLVAEVGTVSPATQPVSQSENENEKVLLQFGKVGKDMFTMDYCYPLSAFQAFAICLSSFDTKLARE